MRTNRFAARVVSLVLAATSLVGVGAITQAAEAAPVVDPGAYVPLAPSRVLDTRTDQHSGIHPDGTPISGQLAAGQVLDVRVAGIGGVPSSGAGAVVLNVAVTNPSAAGHLRVYSGDLSTAPNVANLNFVPGQTIPNLVTVRLGAAGDVNIALFGGGSADVVADVSGYYLGGTTSTPAAGSLTMLGAPQRVLDTRTGALTTPAGPAATGQLTAGHPLDIAIANNGSGSGLPSGSSMSAVILNVAVTNPNTYGNLTVYPGNYLQSVAPPTAANLNFSPGQTISNSVTVQIKSAGDLQIAIDGWTGISADVVVDVFGYYTAGSANQHPGTFVARPPTRILETRAGYPLAGVSSPGVAAGTAVNLTVAGVAGVPAAGGAASPGAVLMNTTVVQPNIVGYVTAYPSDLTSPPGASNLNFVAGDTIPNLVNSKLSANGHVNLLYSSFPAGGRANLVGDLAGYFVVGDPPPTPGPGPVVGLSAVGVNAGEVDLSWTNPSYATGVTICRSKNGGAAMTPSTCVANGGAIFTGASTATNFRDIYLYWSTPYYYWVWATNSAGTSPVATTSGTTLSNANARQNPANNNAPNGLSSSCDYNNTAINQACANGAIADFDAARAQEGLGPIALPSNFGTLSSDPTILAEEQVFVLTNIDRVDRGLPPLDGISATWSAQAGANVYGQDPSLTTPHRVLQGGANWASTFNPFWTEFLWMYDDGVGSPNSGCPPDCWVHRANVLGTLPPQTAMGVSINPSVGTSALYVGYSQFTDWTFTWAGETAFFPKGSPENP